MFGFVSTEAAAAATAGDVLGVLLYLDTHPEQLHNRTIFQSELIHIAARNGHSDLLEELLKRGARINSLDFGGMRRTALHWACLQGHVRVVEQLIAHGADTKVQEKSWAKLVQQGRCGQQIDADSPVEAHDALCANNAVRLALQRPPWTPAAHPCWPARFKAVARLLLLACYHPPGATAPLPRAGRESRLGPAQGALQGSRPAADAGGPSAAADAPALRGGGAGDGGSPAPDAGAAAAGGATCPLPDSSPPRERAARCQHAAPRALAPGAHAVQGEHGAQSAGPGGDGWECVQGGRWVPLDLDVLTGQILPRAAYPISAWV